MIRCKFRSNAKRSRAAEKADNMTTRGLRNAKYANLSSVSETLRTFEESGYQVRPRETIEVWRRND